jgi:hypothetical protein
MSLNVGPVELDTHLDLYWEGCRDVSYQFFNPSSSSVGTYVEKNVLFIICLMAEHVDTSTNLYTIFHVACAQVERKPHLSRNFN